MPSCEEELRLKRNSIEEIIYRRTYADMDDVWEDIFKYIELFYNQYEKRVYLKRQINEYGLRKTLY